MPYEDESEHTMSHRILNSRIVNAIASFPPITWLIRRTIRFAVNKKLQTTPPTKARKALPASDIDSILFAIVYDVVESLGYVGAMVATYEQGDMLPVRALHVDEAVANHEDIRKWEQEISEYLPRKVSIIDPEIALVCLHNEKHQANLSVRAVKAHKPITSPELLSLFLPIIPDTQITREIVRAIQEQLTIKEVIAVPFFIDTGDGQEVVGNLFAAKEDAITEQDKAILEAFGRQASFAIENNYRRLQNQIAQDLTYEIQANLQNEQYILDCIAQGVVNYLGYVGAMVAPYEGDGILSVRSFYVDPAIVSLEDIKTWESTLSAHGSTPVSITNPDIAFVNIHSEAYKDNLSVQAAQVGEPVVSDGLFSLFTPIVPDTEITRSIVQGIQQALDIHQVIAIPFFLKKQHDDNANEQVLMGNLFVATRSKVFSKREREILAMFGRQAAVGLRNANLYRVSEDRRKIAQIFGKMAFSSAASIHELRNHIGFAKANLQLIQGSADLPPDLQKELFATTPRIVERLHQVTDILDNLHEPWRQHKDEPVEVNLSLKRAIEKASRGYALKEYEGEKTSVHNTDHIVVNMSLAGDLPLVFTSQAMLTEAFHVIIKNSFEAIMDARPQQPQRNRVDVEISSTFSETDNAIKVSIRNYGNGIKMSDFPRLFEIQWTAKNYGLGFGLFWVRDYIGNINGQIVVDSRWGEGATFNILLPAQTPHHNQPVA